MAENSAYYRELRADKHQKLTELKSKLPPYVMPYLTDKELTSQISTVVSYAYDLIVFFQFMAETRCRTVTKTSEIPIESLEELTFEDINDFQQYLAFSDNGVHRYSNEYKGIARKMAAVRGFFKYACTHGQMEKDPTLGAATRKKKPQKEIVRLTSEEVGNLLNTIECSDMSSKRQISACKKTRLRDIAVLTLLLNTGIRVSECVGLDIGDVNFDSNTISIVRKGGDTSTIYFNQATADTLWEYISKERPSLLPDESEKALFLSLKKQRLKVRSMQEMVKKFAEVAVPGKNISCHKMRSTYGSALYRETEDIRLVADVLGHRDINTTAKHYAAIEEEHRKKAALINPYD